jgi:hypothetical protein
VVATILIELSGGEGVVRRDDGEIVVTHDVRDGRGASVREQEYRPARGRLDPERSLVGGRVSALAAALDPVALQALLQPVGGDVLRVPAGDQPPVDPGPLKLLVAQRLGHPGEWFGERDLAVDVAVCLA